MSIFNHRKLQAGLWLILIAAVCLCVYSLWSLHQSGGDGSRNMPQQGFGQGQRGAGGGMSAPGRSWSDAGGQAGSGSANGATGQGAGGSSGSSSDGSSGQTHRGWTGQGGNGTSGSFGGGAMGNGGMFRNFGGGSKYGAQLSFYAVLFFGLIAVAYGLYHRKAILWTAKPPRSVPWLLLGIGLTLRIAIAPWVGGHNDLNLFKSWATSAASGLTDFYVKGSSDYPPFFIYILYVIGKIVELPGMNAYFGLLVKLPSILADAATAYLVYRLAAKHLPYGIGLLAAAFYLFNPAIFINSTFWGQVDSFFTLLLVSALLLLLGGRMNSSAAVFAAAVLMKPQGIIFLPVLLFELVRLRSVKRFITAAAAAIGTGLAIILPFSLHQEPMWIVRLYTGTVGEYPYASVNAFNLFSLLGANFKSDESTLLLFSYHTWGMVFIVLVTLFSWLIYLRGRSVQWAFAAALLQIAGVFTLSSSMHERYLFPAAALCLFAWVQLRDKRLLYLAAGFSLTILINTYSILYGDFNMSGGASNDFTLMFTSMLNVVLFVCLAKLLWDLGRTKKPQPAQGVATLE